MRGVTVDVWQDSLPLRPQIRDPQFYAVSRRLEKNQWKSPAALRAEQDAAVRRTIRFAYDHVPYYRRLMNDLSIRPLSIQNVEDLERLPVLSKQMVRDHWQEFIPDTLQTIRYQDNVSSGSTGTPLRYRLARTDKVLHEGLLYRGWGYAGYEFGDRMVMIGGSAIGIAARHHVKNRLEELARNIRKVSSFELGDDQMRQFVAVLARERPRFIRGYASACSCIAQWIADHGAEVPPIEGVFCAAEKLYPAMRRRIEETFSCDCFDGYGLNDGGVSAYECSEHCGLHADTERAVMEVVDRNGAQLEVGEGRILATTLANDAMPFIRYDTGDLGAISGERCACGRGHPLLREVIGRNVDMFVTPDGRRVFGAFFGMFLERCPGVREYQVVQDTPERVTVRIVPDAGFDPGQIDGLREMVKAHGAGWEMDVAITDTIERTGSGKYRFLICNVGNAA
jgi:phenylacetate-CoA ligase